ncbi:hypothetical protein QBC40DRAFT_271384 [Triangularia verruculosa]|uniref:Uncharacterized protein n=1 Tax=Triangularia verruculosa TaxID=2587418 RepID=A0AAN6XTK8_9PEZI|nr:hypothetical protein QBC40DRAFT_271384 [Triangularia verruculosa]
MWRGDVREYRLRQRGDIKWDEYNSLWPRDNGVGNNFIHSTRLKARNDEFDGILRVLSADPDERQYLFKRIKYLMINTTPTWATMGPSRLLGQRWNFLARGSTGWPGQEITADGEEFVRRWEDFGNWWVAEIANQFKIDWKEMPRLQEVYLDLRGLNIPVRMEGESFIYVRCWSGFLLRSFVAKLAKSMSGLHLRRLTIAGLRSYVGKYGYDASSMRDETLNENDLTRGFWDDERELFVDESFCGEVDEAGNGVKTRFINWWMMFVTAVRPGGKLVFVDREYDAEAVIVTDRPDSSLHDWILKGGQPRTWRRDIPGQDDWHPTPAGPVPVVPKRERQPPGVVVEDLVTELKNL